MSQSQADSDYFEGVKLGLWNRHAATNPDFTKEVSFGGRKFTAINPHYQLLEATKEWGTYGDKWGLRDLRYEFVTSQQLDKSKTVYTATSVVLSCEFYYPNGKFPIIVDDQFKVGDDVFKKLLTNARSKALSWLGFNADVFFGDFDDSDYVRDQRVRFGDMEAFKKRVLGEIRVAKSKESLDKMMARVKEMVADETISPELGRELTIEVEAAVKSLTK